MHYKPERASAIINACVVLHNICIINNVPIHEDVNEDVNNLGIMDDVLNENNINDHNIINSRDLTQGKQQRNRVVQYLFNRNIF